MTDKEICEEAIKKAVKNGYDDAGGFTIDFAIFHCCPESFIFDHDFAKAFWGEEWPNKFLGEEGLRGNCPYWQAELSHTVLEKYPLKYIEKYL